MSKKQLLSELENLAGQLDIKIRYETTSARGGLCKHRGKYQIIIDRKAVDSLKINIIASAIVNFDLSNLYIPPKLREFLEL